MEMNKEKKLLQEGGEKEMALDTLYDAKFITARYGISRGTLSNWIHDKKIPYKKLGKQVRFSEKDLAKWEKQRAIQPIMNNNERTLTNDTL